jgi:transcriptional regulator with XRE-family HTH domain
MTTAQLAKRLNVSQPRVHGIEKAEASGGIKLESLERVARALENGSDHSGRPQPS